MDELSIALYGINGHQLFPYLSSLKRCRLSAVAGVTHDMYENLAKATPSAFRHTVYCETLDNILERKDVDMVSICSPRRDKQPDDCIKALFAGKHVLAEKPAATNREDLNRLIEAVKKSKRQFRLMTTMIYDAPSLKMKETVDSGALGEIIQLYGMKSYPYHDRRPQDNGIDGGLTLQALIHAVSMARFLTGQEFSEVFAQETGRSNPGTGDLKMAVNFAGRMKNGILVSLLANYLNPPGIGFHGNDQIRIFGSKGVLESVDGFTLTRAAFANSPFKQIAIEPGPSAYPQDYIDELLGGQPALMSMEDGFQNTSAALAARESADSGRLIKL